ncbi:TlpA family protein disulfide reductase [Parapedobacter deserti]|uniref:TlpA family protein disulfide reductase n=1 Tax=Parapedobacter deserti TaxID=1912957 RepID=A0ABV7JGF4_9SPHI
MFPRSLVLLLFCCTLALAASAAKRKATVTGKLTGYAEQQVTLNVQEYAVLAGQEKVETTLAGDGTFSFAVELTGPARAFLVLGTSPVEERFTVQKADGRDTTITTQTNRAALVYLYLTPGSKQHLTVDANDVQNTLQITGKGSAASRYLNEEDWRFNRYQDKHLKNYFSYMHYPPELYVRYVEQRKADRLAFLQQYARQNRLPKHLRYVSERTIRGDAVTARLLYPSMRNSYRKDDFVPDDSYYSFMEEVEIDYSRSDKGIAYFYFLDYYLKESHRLAGTDEDYFDWVKTKLSGWPLYEYYAFALASNFKKKLYDHFGSDSPYPQLAAKVKAKYQQLEGMLEGSPAPAVVLYDTSGSKVSLSELNGQYLYLDFWATWCGPCIQEIPALEALQHDYQGRNIAFVSISVDKEADRQKWKDFVASQQLKGIQVWADATNSRKFTEAFNIRQIPRFVLLDPAGNIVDANAARPSDKRIRQLLDKLL